MSTAARTRNWSSPQTVRYTPLGVARLEQFEPRAAQLLELPLPALAGVQVLLAGLAQSGEHRVGTVLRGGQHRDRPRGIVVRAGARLRSVLFVHRLGSLAGE